MSIWRLGHPTAAEDLPAGSLNLIRQPLGEPLVVPVVRKQGTPPVAAGDNVVDRTRELPS